MMCSRLPTWKSSATTDTCPKIDQTFFTTAIEDEVISAAITSCKEDVMVYAITLLERFHPRDAYHCELMDCTIIALKCIPPRGIPSWYP